MAQTTFGRWIACAALALLLSLGAAAPSPAADAGTSTCPTTNPYPGDAAGQPAIAGWMARGAAAAGLPGELPVMAGLVESGLQNLPDTGSGYAGFFQMSRKYFGTGEYAGFERRPELQLLWFTDTAVDIRERRLDAGKPDPLTDESSWGEWIADVERPAPQYRGRYQLRLEEARDLIGSGCGASTPQPGPGDPALTLWGGTEQALGRRVRVAVVCASACEVSVGGTLRLAGLATRYDLEPAAGSVPGGEKLKLALSVSRPALRAARKAVRRGTPVRARLDVSAVAGNGAATTQRRVVRIG